MNTMGFDYHGQNYDISENVEINAVRKAFAKRNMTLLPKSHNATFSNGSGSTDPDADLDHVFASSHLVDKFEIASDGSIVEVGGWVKFADQKDRDRWIKDYSDHAPLTFKLHIG